MPGRLIPLVEGQVYHVFNRGIDSRTTFSGLREFQRVQLLAHYYRFRTPPVRFSKFMTLDKEVRDKWISDLAEVDDKLVEVLAYCFMDNHFHFLLKQLSTNGISKFMANFQNSYTRYFNTKHERIGPLFLDQFKAVRIVTDEQLVHVSRYIHLNPLTAYLVKDFEELKNYSWSSLNEYLGEPTFRVSQPGEVMAFFKKSQSYEKFLVDQVGYQRELDRIKHLILE